MGEAVNQPTDPDPLLCCADLCGATVADDINAIMQAGWTYLETTKRYRCGACVRALEAASKFTGTSLAASVDTLPPYSIGGLRKATADTILPPSVKP